MDKIVIEGTQVYDGEYEFDPSHFTLGEFRRIKQVADLSRGQIVQALANDDTNLWVAFAVLALERQGASYVDVDVFWDAKDASITLVAGDDAGPPELTGSPTTGPDGNSDTSGGSSEASSEPNPGTDRKATGSGSWGLSTSPPTTSPA